MADIPGWLRGFQRARVPSITPLSDRLSLLDEANEIAGEKYGVPSTARLSSHQEFGLLTVASSSADSHPHLNQVEQIWHNPDPGQMAETLKVAMMTQNSFDPLHVSYNSCILHVLEAYHSMRKELLEKDLEIRDRERRHKSDIEEFGKQQQQWKRKEEEYRSKLKKLEVMLATGARGLELVTLARSRSALNETPRAEATESQRLEKGNNYHNMASDEEPMMSDFAERKDSLISSTYTLQKRKLNARYNNRWLVIPRPSHRRDSTIMMRQPDRDAKHENKNKTADSDTTHFKQLYDMARMEKGSDFLSGLGQQTERSTEQHVRPLRGCVSNRTNVERGRNPGDGSKPHTEVRIVLGEISEKGSIKDEEDGDRLCNGENLFGRSVAHHKRFSFIPGDDYGNLALSRRSQQATVLALDGSGDRGRHSSLSCLPSSPNIKNSVPHKGRGLTRPALGERGENTTRKKKPTTVCEFEPTRSDSQTSIVTTIQYQNGGSIKCSEPVMDAPRRPKPSRLSGSNEAKIAAVLAISEGEKAALSAT